MSKVRVFIDRLGDAVFGDRTVPSRQRKAKRQKRAFGAAPCPTILPGMERRTMEDHLDAPPQRKK